MKARPMSIHRSGLLSDASLFSRLLRTDIAEGGGRRFLPPAQSVPFSTAKTAVSPLASVPSKRQVASASSTSPRMSRRRGRAP